MRLKDTIFRVERSIDTFAERYNEELLDSIRRFREAHRVLITKHPAFNVHIFYLTRGDATKIASDVEKKAKEIEVELREILATVTKCTFTFIGARELIGLFRKPPKSTFPLECKNSIASGPNHLALVKLSDFYRFISGENGELLEYLFESNVRDYQGDVEVNKQIRETLNLPSDTADFWWLNNGITILSPKLGGHTQLLTVDDPQIVNGLQTSMEIYEHCLRLDFWESGVDHPDRKVSINIEGSWKVTKHVIAFADHSADGSSALGPSTRAVTSGREAQRQEALNAPSWPL